MLFRSPATGLAVENPDALATMPSWLVDGLRPDVAEARLTAGHLPHLADTVRQGGRTHAITGFPSTTSVAYLPFLTGCAPGRCDIPSIRWLDRARYGGRWWRDRGEVRSYCGYQAPLLDRDLSTSVRTIFERNQRTAAVTNALQK